MRDSFKRLPSQLEWIFPAIIVFCTYLFFHSKGLSLILIFLTILIILNGWISSHASSEIYSDFLLITDTFIIAIYICLALSLQNFTTIGLTASYWFYSSALCFAYMLWDIIFFFMLKDEDWKKKFITYIVLMGVYSVLFLTLAIFKQKELIHDIALIIIGSILWLSVLIKWHWDKLRGN
jgi:hypothetical protein